MISISETNEKERITTYNLEPEKQKNLMMAPHIPLSSYCSASRLFVSSRARELSSLSIPIITLDFSVEIIFDPTFKVALCQYRVFFRKIHLQFVNLNIVSKVEGNIIGDLSLTSLLQFITFQVHSSHKTKK